MTEPRIEVLGVYRLYFTDDLVNEQLSILYPEQLSETDRVAAELQIHDQLSSVVLIEAIVHHRDYRFDVGDFMQPKEGEPRDSWQAAWAEAYLTADGKDIEGVRGDPPPESGDLRIAFFIHYWIDTQPLLSSYGMIECPLPQAIPDRLAKLVPYELLD